MKRKVTKLIGVVVALGALVALGLVPMSVAGASGTTIIDASWQKTTNYSIDDTLATTSHAIGDSYWTWTSDVWDGPSSSLWTPSDFWAKWYSEGGFGQYTHYWFKTTLDIPGQLTDDIRLVNKYNNSILSINDDLYVYVNGERVASGGTAPAVTGRPADFMQADRNSSVAPETDGWYINGGLTLPKENFQPGVNTICILTDDYSGSGGLGHLVFEVPPISVNVDIKPGSDNNSINLGSDGVVPVAILGSADFDVSTIDPSTVTLSGASLKLKGKSGNAGSLTDVNGDGYMDLVVQVYTDELDLVAGSTEATVSGETYDGLSVVGEDSVTIVPSP